MLKLIEAGPAQTMGDNRELRKSGMSAGDSWTICAKEQSVGDVRRRSCKKEAGCCKVEMRLQRFVYIHDRLCGSSRACTTIGRLQYPGTAELERY